MMVEWYVCHHVGQDLICEQWSELHVCQMTLRTGKHQFLLICKIWDSGKLDQENLWMKIWYPVGKQRHLQKPQAQVIKMVFWVKAGEQLRVEGVFTEICVLKIQIQGDISWYLLPWCQARKPGIQHPGQKLKVITCACIHNTVICGNRKIDLFLALKAISRCVLLLQTFQINVALPIIYNLDLKMLGETGKIWKKPKLK